MRLLHLILVTAVASLLQQCSSDGKSTDRIMEKKIIFTPTAPKPIGPYSQAILCGNTLYCSGQIALDTSGNLLNDSIETETKQVVHNIAELLKAAEMNFENIIKTSIFLTDMNDFAKVNTIYSESFTSTFPARETVEVRGLPKGARVEISVIASK